MTASTVSHYRLVEKLGVGGMGEVWVAEDETLHRRVALKAIRADHRLEPSSRARFLREAQILSQLDHPHICRIHDYLAEGQQDYLVLELIEGADLTHAIERGLDRSEVLGVASKVNDALVAAHAEGIVHRDLKPANVMLTPDGGVKVLDFGLAATGDGPAIERPMPVEGATAADPEVALTEAGAIVGTLRYMSPEQARGEPATAASDMYALGLMLVELRVGHSAYPILGDVQALLENVRRGAAVPGEMRKTELGRLAAQLLDPAPTRRPTAVDVEERLRWIRDRPRRIARRGVIATIAIAAILGGVKYTVDLGEERNQAEMARLEAEDLVDFMLGELHDELRRVGRLDALGETADKVLAYLERRRADDRDDATEFRYARTLVRIGQVRFDQHRMGDARQHFGEARATLSELCLADPSDLDRKFELATAEFWIGYAYLVDDDIDLASRSFEDYRAYARELVTSEPENPKYLKELGYAHTNICAIHQARGDKEAAIEEARDGLEIKRALLALDPLDEENQRLLAKGLGWMAAALKKAGQYDEAGEFQGQALGLHRQLVDANPEDAAALEELSIALSWQADLLVFQGQEESARAARRADLDISRRLVELEPANVQWRSGLALSRRTLAGALLRAGRPDDAELLMRLSRTSYDELSALDPQKLNWLKALAKCHDLEAAICLERGQADEALRATASATAYLERFLEAGDESDDSVETGGHILTHRALAFEELERPGEARACWLAAEADLTPRAQGGESKMIVSALVRVLVGLERAEEAEPIARKLFSTGFAHRDFVRLCEQLGWMDKWL